MALFPRTVLPNQSRTPKVPGSLVSVGNTGGIHQRSNLRAGREWTERWWSLDPDDADVQALIASVEQHHNTAEFATVTHLLLPGSGRAPLGAGGGTPLVAGASQSGSSLAVDGATATVTNWKRAGDVFTIAGLDQLFRVLADANSDGGGNVTLSINPPILAGSSPADNAALTLTGCLLRAKVIDYDLAPSEADEFVSLQVRFREAP